MFLVFLLSGSMGIWYFFRPVGKRETNLLLSFFLGILALSLLHNLLVNIGLFNGNPRWYFIPIQYTLALGPLLFFFVKSRLYQVFHLQKKDFKHFILPVVQAFSYLAVGFQGAIHKETIWNTLYLPYGKPLEGFFFVVGFSFYAYVSYRFIRYKLNLLAKRQAYFWEVDKVKRLKRMVKVLLLLFSISAAYIIGDFLTYQLLGKNLYNLPGYTYIGDLSFTFIVLWVSYYAFRNAFFPSRKRLVSAQPLDPQLASILKKGKLFLDDELDTRKLSYYLRVKKSQLPDLLQHPLPDLLKQFRIEEAKQRMQSPRYKHYSLESIGLDVGFPHKDAFFEALKEEN